MISGGIEVNQFTLICLILEKESAEDLFISHIKLRWLKF